MEETQSRQPGRPKKQERAPFVGFTQASIQNEYFRMPAIWINVCAEIDNLAELKVVQYVLKHTWGYRDYEGMKRITIDEFVNGRKYTTGERAGLRMDLGTGLSDKAVKEGLARAIEHGLIVCVVDDRDKARVKKYYALHMQDEREQNTETLEEIQGGIPIPSEGNNIPDEGNDNPPYEESYSPRSKERTLEQTYRTMDIRIPHPQNTFLEGVPSRTPGPEPQKKRQRYPLFIQRLMADFSAEYGDDEHIRSNISQANNIYLQSGMGEQEFTEVMYAAIATAKQASIKKLNAKGRPNRVPYFFKCLNQLAVCVATG